MANFQARVKKAIAVGDLTVADLQNWFSRPYPTVWRWVHSGWVPRGPQGRKAERDLAVLEKLVAAQRVFPVPSDIGGRDRRGYVRGAYATHARLPQARSAR